MSEAAGNPAQDSEMVELARAHDRFEASVWIRHLEDMGIPFRTETIGGWLRAILYLGRRPVVVFVPASERQRAHDFLKQFRFI